MTIPVLIILGALWAAVLVPPLLRARSDRRSGAIGDYAHTLGVLKPNSRTLNTIARPAAGLVDGSMHSQRHNRGAAIRKRRRDVFTALLASAGITLVLAFVLSSPLVWLIHILVDLVLGAYIYILLQIKEQQRLRKMNAPVSYDD